MAKDTKKNNATDTTDIQENEMTNNNTNSHELTFALEVNETGTSRRLVGYHNAEWDPTRDLSIIDLRAAEGALEMFAKAAAGNLNGSPKLLLTAPVTKIGYQQGTGTMGYVRYDYQPNVDAVEVDIDGVNVLLDVDPRDIPDEGYKRLYLNAGKLYSKGWEKPFTERDENTFMYWYARVGSALLDKHCNVSVSIGPKTLQRAEGVMAVINSDNPDELNEQRRHFNRQVARANRGTHNDVHRYTEVATSANAEAFEVPAAHGGVISLVDWPFNEPIPVRNSAGFAGKPVRLEEDSAAGRLAAAVSIRNEPGLAVDIS